MADPSPATVPTARPPAGSHMMVFVGVTVCVAWVALQILPFLPWVEITEARERWLANNASNVNTLMVLVVGFYFGTSFGARTRLARDMDSKPAAPAAPVVEPPAS